MQKSAVLLILIFGTIDRWSKGLKKELLTLSPHCYNYQRFASISSTSSIFHFFLSDVSILTTVCSVCRDVLDVYSPCWFEYVRWRNVSWNCSVHGASVPIFLAWYHAQHQATKPSTIAAAIIASTTGSIRKANPANKASEASPIKMRTNGFLNTEKQTDAFFSP